MNVDGSQTGKSDSARTGVASNASPAARSLFGEILDWMLAPLLLLWPVSIAVTYLIAKSIASVPFDHALESKVSVLVRQLDGRNGTVTLPLAESSRDWLLDDPDDLTLFQVRSATGRVIAGSALIPAPSPQEISPPGIVRFRETILDGREIRLAYAYAILPGSDDKLTALVQVAETQSKRSALANDIIKGVIFPQFIILPLVIMLVWFGLARGLTPLHTLQAKIRARRPDDLSPLAIEQAPLEIALLLRSFNDLLLRLDENTAAQKRFIAQAAHQMKTPLAGLRMQAELALRQPVSAEVQHSLEQIATSSRQAARLVSQLLSLARAENSARQRSTEAVDIDSLAQSVVRDWVRAAFDKAIDLGYEGPDAQSGVVIRAQPLMLREMLSNLIDNAIRYTPFGGSVTVRIKKWQAETTAMLASGTMPNATVNTGIDAAAITDADLPAIAIEVEDTGPGIPESERDKVLERFYRILGCGGDGSGLGLAIVNEIVSMHGGTLTITEHWYHTPPSPPGTLIRVILPFTPATLVVQNNVSLR